MLIIGTLKDTMSCYYNAAEDSWELLLDSEAEIKRKHMVYKNYKYYFKGKLYHSLTNLLADNGYDFYKMVNISPVGVKFLFRKNRIVLQ